MTPLMRQYTSIKRDHPDSLFGQYGSYSIELLRDYLWCLFQRWLLACGLHFLSVLEYMLQEQDNPVVNWFLCLRSAWLTPVDMIVFFIFLLPCDSLLAAWILWCEGTALAWALWSAWKHSLVSFLGLISSLFSWDSFWCSCFFLPDLNWSFQWIFSFHVLYLRVLSTAVILREQFLDDPLSLDAFLDLTSLMQMLAWDRRFWCASMLFSCTKLNVLVLVCSCSGLRFDLFSWGP